jgi:hypothetical protein
MDDKWPLNKENFTGKLKIDYSFKRKLETYRNWSYNVLVYLNVFGI